MAKIRRIEPKTPILKKRKKVAAYCRISMETERMSHSLSAQVSYYSALIQKNPEWEYAGVYADNSVSGTSAKWREEFQRLLADCEAGKIDIVLTKSISRFARNTVDLLETVRHLKSLGIEVRFEKERINSLSGDGELMLTILASFAQEESRSISENVKWGTRKRFQQGIPNGQFRIYGYRWKDDQLVIEPSEAAVVRRIFQNFLDGKSRIDTAKELNAEGIPTMKGCRWADSNVKSIITNITYTGNLLFQKEYVVDPISKKSKKNRGELPQYWVADTHEPIIERETFDYVQKEMARRRELGFLANKALKLSCFSGKIKCGICGRSYIRSSRKKHNYVIWCCTSTKGKASRSCGVRGLVPEKKLKSVCAEVLGLAQFDENIFAERIEKIIVSGRNTLAFYFFSGEMVEKEWQRTARKDIWQPERKAMWHDYRMQGSRKGTGIGFREYVARRNEDDGEIGNDDTSDNQ